ncbi:transposase [Micromonospora endolithica]|uniref:transposase n=1 Tax=Micromonospora endolithica TaxID=230091 RepID=UPI003B50123A
MSDDGPTPAAGRTPTHDLRKMFDAIVYVNRTGIAWRYLPHDFLPHPTVYGYFVTWSKEGICTELKYQLTGIVRDHHGRTIARGGAAAANWRATVYTSTLADTCNCSEAVRSPDAGPARDVPVSGLPVG